MKDNNLPIWNGEFGPVYGRAAYDGPERAEEINESRYRLLDNQLEIYDEERISWSIWLYKDIGFQGNPQSTSLPEQIVDPTQE